MKWRSVSSIRHCVRGSGRCTSRAVKEESAVLEKGSTSLASPSPLTGASTGLASIEVGTWLGPASTTGLATGAGCVGVEEGGGEGGRAESGGVAVGAVMTNKAWQ